MKKIMSLEVLRRLSRGFCAGADLGDMAAGMLGGSDLQAAFNAGWRLNGALRALETCGKPVAAAITGTGSASSAATTSRHVVVAEGDGEERELRAKP